MLASLLFNLIRIKKTLILGGIAGTSAAGITSTAIFSDNTKSLFGTDFDSINSESKPVGGGGHLPVEQQSKVEREDFSFSNIQTDPNIADLYQRSGKYINIEPSINLDQYKKFLFNPEGLIESVAIDELNSESLTDLERLGLLSSSVLETLTLDGTDKPVEKMPNRQSFSFISSDPFEDAVQKGRSFWRETLHLFPTKGLFHKYGDFFKTRLNNADTEKTQKKIYMDLIYGLLEWAEHEQLIIRPNINVGFNLDKEISMEDLHLVPVHYFSLSFNVANPLSKKTTLFGQIEIEPFSEWEVNIKLRKGALKHVGRNYNKQLIAMSTWGIVPLAGGNFSVSMKLKQDEGKEVVIKKYELDDIKFMFGASKYGKESLENMNTWSWELWNKSYLEMLTWGDVEAKIKSKLMAITPEQAKKDLERYYGPYSLMWIRSAFEDISNGLSYLIAKFEVDPQGKPISILNKVLNNQGFRNFVYNSNGFTEWQRSLVEGIVSQAKQTNKGKDSTIDSTELEAFIESFKYQIADFLKNFRVDFTWEKDPSLKAGRLGNYPLINFKFKQRYYWDKTTKIFFKGIWNTTKKTTTAWNNSTNTGEVAFDIPKLFLDPEKVFGGLAKLIGQSSFIGEILPGLFTNLKDFIGLEKIEFQQSDEIVFTYEANDSPTALAVQPTNDYFDYINAENILVWKALDVKSSHDFKNFFSILMQVFNKLECFKWVDKNGSFDVSELRNMDTFLKGFKKDPLKTTVHAINSLFGIGYGTDKNQKTISGCEGSSTDSATDWKLPTNREKHPWFIFFQKLLEKEVIVNSRQLVVGYPSFVYSYPANMDDSIKKATEAKIKEWASTEGTTAVKVAAKPSASDATKTSTYAAISYSELNKSVDEKERKKLKSLSFIYPVLLSDPELHVMLQKLFITFGVFYPNNPIVYAKKNLHYARLTDKLNKSDDFNSNAAFVINKDKLFETINESFSEKQFDYAKHTPWHSSNKYLQGLKKDEVKISTFNLSVKSALEAVLAMSLNLSGIGSLALGFLDINVPELISNAFKRDFYLINFNTMKPQGMWHWFNIENIYSISYTANSDFLMFIPQNFNHCHLETKKGLIC